MGQNLYIYNMVFNNPVSVFFSLFNLKKIAESRQEILWVVIGQSMTFIGGFASIKILTTLLGPQEYGLMALGLTIAGILTMFVYGPFGQSVMRFFSIYKDKDLSRYFFNVKLIHKYCFVLLASLSLMSWFAISIIVDEKWGLVVASALFFGILSGISNTFISFYSTARMRNVAAIHQGIEAWLKPLFAIILITLFNAKGYISLLGFCLSSAVIICSQFVFFFKRTPFGDFVHTNNCITPDYSSLREFLTYAGSICFFAGFAAISMYSDRWVIQGFMGSSDVGIYAAIYQIANAPIILITGIINQLMVPIIFEKAKILDSTDHINISSNLLKLTTTVLIILFIIIVFITFIFEEKIVLFLTNSRFIKYKYILTMLVIGISIFHIGQTLVLKGLYHNKPQIYFTPKAIQALSLILLSLILGRYYHLYGISFAVIISSILYLISVHYINQVKLQV